MATTIKVVVILLSGFLLGIYAAPNVVANENEIRKCQEEHDIDKMIPLNEILTEVLAANKYDPEVKTAFEHIGSSEFRTKTDRLESRKEYLDFVDYCRRNNLRIPEALNFAKTVLPALVSQATMDSFPGINQDQISGGVHGLVMRIFEKHLSMKDIRHCIQARSECDPEYREKMNNLRSGEFQKLLKNLRSTDEYKEIVKDLEGYKIYFEVYLNSALDHFDIPH